MTVIRGRHNRWNVPVGSTMRVRVGLPPGPVRETAPR